MNTADMVSERHLALDFPRTAIKAKAQRLAGLALQDGLELERLKSREIIRNHKKLNIK